MPSNQGNMHALCLYLPPTFQDLVPGGIDCSAPTPLFIARETQPPMQHCSALQPVDVKLVGADDWRGETDELKDNAKGPPRPLEDPLPFTSAAPCGGSLGGLDLQRKAQPRLKSLTRD